MRRNARCRIGAPDTPPPRRSSAPAIRRMTCDPYILRSIQNEETLYGTDRWTAIERIAMLPTEGARASVGALAVVSKLEGTESDGRFAVVEHRLPGHALAAPLHFHHNEDEYSFVLEGTLGVLLGEEVIEAGAGSWVLKPRGEWHCFWNAGARPCRIIELISPAGLECYFREVQDAFAGSEDGAPDLDRYLEVNQRFNLEMDFDSVTGLCKRFGLTHPLALVSGRLRAQLPMTNERLPQGRSS